MEEKVSYFLKDMSSIKDRMEKINKESLPRDSVEEWNTKAKERDKIDVGINHMIDEIASWCFETKKWLEEQIENKWKPLVQSSQLCKNVMNSGSKAYENDGISFYRIPLDGIGKEGFFKVDLKTKDSSTSKKETIAVMMTGMTGAGKTSLLNTIANFVYGVEHHQDFRFILVDNEYGKQNVSQSSTNEVHSMTKNVFGYLLKWQPGFLVDYNLLLIDTPGFSDTDGLDRDREIAEQIREFLSDMKKTEFAWDKLHIGFVCPVSTTKLTAETEYVLNEVLKLSKCHESIMSSIFTFADAGLPPAMKTLQSYGINWQWFKFNNSAIFNENKSEAGQSMWEFGCDQAKKYLDYLGNKSETTSSAPRETSDTQEIIESSENTIASNQPNSATEQFKEKRSFAGLEITKEKCGFPEALVKSLNKEYNELKVQLSKQTVGRLETEQVDMNSQLLQESRRIDESGKELKDILEWSVKVRAYEEEKNRQQDSKNLQTTSSELSRFVLDRSEKVKSDGKIDVLKIPLVEELVLPVNQSKCVVSKLSELFTSNSDRETKQTFAVVLSSSNNSLLDSNSVLNTIINLVYGVKFPDNFRLTVPEVKRPSRNLRGYYLEWQSGFTIDFNLLIFDALKTVSNDIELNTTLDNLAAFFSSQKLYDHFKFKPLHFSFVCSATSINKAQLSKFVRVLEKHSRGNFSVMFSPADASTPRALHGQISNDNRFRHFKLNSSALLKNNIPSDEGIWKFNFDNISAYLEHIRLASKKTEEYQLQQAHRSSGQASNETNRNQNNFQPETQVKASRYQIVLPVQGPSSKIRLRANKK